MPSSLEDNEKLEKKYFYPLTNDEYMKKVFFVFGFTCNIKEPHNANVFVTRICHLLCQYWKKINIDEDKFLIGIGSRENGGKFDNGKDQFS